MRQGEQQQQQQQQQSQQLQSQHNFRSRKGNVRSIIYKCHPKYEINKPQNIQ